MNGQNQKWRMVIIDFFDEYEKDIVNLVQATRNHPIVMWSSGNEGSMGRSWCKRAKWLQEIFHREDPTRPVTVVWIK
jgi:beta-galactosidase